MNKRDVTTKLAATEASLKRWQSRLKRAATKVNELDRQRRRYQLQLSETPISNKLVTAKAELVQAVDDQLTNIIEGKPVDMATLEEKAIPAFLDRADPVIAEKMTAARKAAEAEERKRMPLAGKAASDYIKAPRKRKG